MKSKIIIYIALASDVLIAITKFMVAGFTHSSAMLSEGVHSVIDAISQVLLLWGVVISKKEPDAERPFGYGKELYFWSFIVSLLIFMMGGCISLYEGILRFKHPTIAENETWNYIVLAISFVFTAVSAYVSFKAFNIKRGDTSFWKAVTASRDPSIFIVLLGDLGDLVCLIIAFAGIWIAHTFHNPYADAVASVLIGIVLICISLLLVRESRSLLMGETVRKATVQQIIRLAEADPAIVKVKEQRSMYLAPEEVLLYINAVFKQDLTTNQITDAISHIIAGIQQKFPSIKRIYIEPVKDE